VIFHQYYLDCLSHASYLVGDETTGRAVVVDPQRDVGQYLADARDFGLTIEHVIETHFHADFLSGHLELAEQTGATIAYGAAASGAAFPIERLEHGERLVLGDVVLEIRATPGHTPESISIVVYEHHGDDVPYGVLTGDTLFIGDVGRPDLLASVGVSADELARQLYRSTRVQLLTLPDATRVFPAHGAGSACGKQLSTETTSTIGEQRRANYALADMTEDEFVAVITEGQPVAPPYFAFDAARNREERALLDEGVAPEQLTLAQVLDLQRAGAVVVDTREAGEYALGHLRGSLEVGLGGRFAEYAGDVIGPHQQIVLVSERGTEHEARIRLARIGFDNVVGALADPLREFLEHPEHVARSSRVTVEQLDRRLADGVELQIVDVRNPGETALGAIDGATLHPLARLVDELDQLDGSAPTVVYCAGGYRSAIAASTLEVHGFTDVSDLLGGYEAWVQHRNAAARS
jgi:glyoxylase-like metal-dependent hydrolase (beta-lactamase superfamily II)/rhodanese-related sulfurtransferase